MRAILTRRIVAISGIVLLLVASALLLDEIARSSSSKTNSENANPTSSSTEPLTQPSSTDNSTGNNGQVSVEEQSAILAAANATSSLSSSLFLPEDKMKGVVTEVVAPTMREKVELTYTAIAPKIASQLGYPTVYEAGFRANYYVQTQMYRVGEITDTYAKIWLYTVTHFRTVDGSRYKSPSISLIIMVKSGEKWLYVSAEDPPKDKVPTPQTGLTFKATVARFKPYLRGFSSYAQAGD